MPANLHGSVLQAGYTSPTQAVIRGFEMIVQAQSEESLEVVRGQMQAIRRQMQAEIESLQSHVERLTLALQEASNPLEITELRARYEELEKHNETLKKELERAGKDKDVMQNLYNNYMLQMQFLISQKAIASPSSAENNPPTESVVSPIVQEAETPTQKEEKSNILLEKPCKYCNKVFTAKNPKNAYCSNKCKTAQYRKEKKEAGKM